MSKFFQLFTISIFLLIGSNIYSNELPYVTIAILAKDKSHTLPLYLSCIENQTWPKDKIYLYIRTNNNNDDTAKILQNWVEEVGHLYAKIYFDDTNVHEEVENYKQHEWNLLRFQVLGKIRQDSVDWAKKENSHYFVVDCDNFILPYTLEMLFNSNLPIVAPFLKTSFISSRPHYSNYHASVDSKGYFVNTDTYWSILNQEIKGLIEVPVVHCSYFIQHDYLDKIVYDDQSMRYEYVIFSDNARKKNIPQYLDNRLVYGHLTFAETKEQFIIEPWLYKFQNEDEVIEETFTNIYNNAIWAKNEEGKGSSGEGSTASNTVIYRAFLQNFLKEHHILSVVDAGCGDWEFSHLINWENIDYKGYDIVKHVIEENQSKYENKNINFYHGNFLTLNLPKADLFISKDVFQHLPNKDIENFLPQLKKYKYCLLINDSATYLSDDNNKPTSIGGYRRLDLTLPPFNLKGERILLFKSGYVFKEVFLIVND